VTAIDSLDQQLERLERSADSEEIDRIANRLEALGPESAGEDEQNREMRQLLNRQRELALAATDRMERKTAQRGQLLSLLRDLWSQLQKLTSRTPAAPESIDRVRSLCAEIERRASTEGIPGEDSTLARAEDLPTMPQPKGE
jgi:hypothetical protein